MRVPAIAELPNGDLWFGSNGTGAYIYNGTEWLRTNCNGDCYVNTAAFKDKNNMLWVAANKLLKHNGSSFSEINRPSTSGELVRFSQNSAGEILVAYGTGGAMKLSGTNWQDIFQQSYTIGGPVLSVLQDSKGRVWVGTQNKGIILFEGSKVTLVDDLGGSKNNITKILEDKNGVIWLGNSFGLWSYQ